MISTVLIPFFFVFVVQYKWKQADNGFALSKFGVSVRMKQFFFIIHSHFRSFYTDCMYHTIYCILLGPIMGKILYLHICSLNNELTKRPPQIYIYFILYSVQLICESCTVQKNLHGLNETTERERENGKTAVNTTDTLYWMHGVKEKSRK